MSRMRIRMTARIAHITPPRRLLEEEPNFTNITKYLNIGIQLIIQILTDNNE